MGYVLVAILNLLAGILVVYILFDRKRKALDEQSIRVHRDMQALEQRLEALQQRETEVRTVEAHLTVTAQNLEQRKVTLEELQRENGILKRDLKNLDTNIWKLQLDRDKQQHAQEEIQDRVQDIGSRYLNENVKWISRGLTPTNFANCKQRLQKVIDLCRGIGFEISESQESNLLGDLKAEFEKVVRAAFEREEQARIRAQIREEQKREREIQRELDRLAREKAAIQAALEKALAEAQDEHSAEVEALKQRLAEAEANSQRAISQAQLTKSGHVYVISNIGSFGQEVYKVGLTRRLEPLDRVKELGDASVPFPFDVHMMFSSDDAPKLERTLHHALHKNRLNRVNPRKEFFRSSIDEIRRIVEENHGEVQYQADPEALEYRQSLEISDQDEEYIESVYDKLDDEVGDGRIFEAD